METPFPLVQAASLRELEHPVVVVLPTLLSMYCPLGNRLALGRGVTDQTARLPTVVPGSMYTRVEVAQAAATMSCSRQCMKIKKRSAGSLRILSSSHGKKVAIELSNESYRMLRQFFAS